MRGRNPEKLCQRSLNLNLKAIHNVRGLNTSSLDAVSKIVKSESESNSQLADEDNNWYDGCVKDR